MNQGMCRCCRAGIASRHKLKALQAAFHAWGCRTLRHRQLRRRLLHLAARTRVDRLKSALRGWHTCTSLERHVGRSADAAGRLRTQRWYWGVWRADMLRERAARQRLRIADAHYESRRCGHGRATHAYIRGAYRRPAEYQMNRSYVT